MATEYKLSYTATEIDEKLGLIDVMNNNINNDISNSINTINSDIKNINDDISHMVKTINGVEPDENGNVEVVAGGGNTVPSYSVTGTEFIVNDETVIADEGAEIFNDYEHNIATGWMAHAEGSYTIASADECHAEGSGSVASGWASHAENEGVASGDCSHAEGISIASDDYAHAEGDCTIAKGDSSHAEGEETQAIGDYSHTQGFGTIAPQSYMDAIGKYNINEFTYYINEKVSSFNYYRHIDDFIFHPELGKFELINLASNECQYGEEIIDDYYVTRLAIEEGEDGKFYCEEFIKLKSALREAVNRPSYMPLYYEADVEEYVTGPEVQSKYAHVIGNGESDTSRSNAHTVDWDGNAWYAGTIEGTALIIKSSTEGSNKRFKISVDDSGTIIATELIIE